jgi:hypothetical protein
LQELGVLGCVAEGYTAECLVKKSRLWLEKEATLAFKLGAGLEGEAGRNMGGVTDKEPGGAEVMDANE